ncbi:MAG: hypothetical protein ABI333_17940 [bacterium]
MTARAKTWIRTLTACFCIFLLNGCGDDDGGTNDNVNQNANANDNDNTNQNNNNVTITPYTGSLDALNGYYQMTSVTFRPSSMDVEVTREPTMVSLPEISGNCFIRGHGEVIASSATAGELDLRWVVIGDDMLHGELPWKRGVELWTATWEQAAGKLVLDASTMTSVYILGYESDVITMVLDESDSRNNFTDAPVRLEMTAYTPQAADITGTWNIQQLRTTGYRTMTRTAECSPLDPEDTMQGTHATLSGAAVIEDTGWITSHFVATTYDSSDCSGTPVATKESPNLIYFEIDNAADTLVWYWGDDAHVSATWSYAINGTTLTMTMDDFHASIAPSLLSIFDLLIFTAAP